MFVQALVDTALYNEIGQLTLIKKGGLVQTTLSLYKQYCTGVNSKTVKPVSHKMDGAGMRRIYICEALKELSISYEGGILTFKKGDQLFLNEIETDRYTRRKWVKTTYHKDLLIKSNEVEKPVDVAKPVDVKSGQTKALDDHNQQQKDLIKKKK